MLHPVLGAGRSRGGRAQALCLQASPTPGSAPARNLITTPPSGSWRLSIIIPCLNEGAIVRPALLALQWLRTRGHELILVDGGSSDGTPDLVPDLVDLMLHSPPGRAVQMNLGARRAKGAVFWFLHLDTEVPPGADERLLTALGDGPGWGRFDVRLSGRQPLFRLVEWMMNQRSRLTGIATGDQGLFVSRDWFEAVGGYPEIALMEDIELSRRLKRLGRPHSLQPALRTSSRRWEHRGPLRTILLMWSLRLAHALGVDPRRLAAWYRTCSSPKRES